jgi:hypothetical protein
VASATVFGRPLPSNKQWQHIGLDPTGSIALRMAASCSGVRVSISVMAAEATCISKPMTVIPLVVTQVQDVIAAGQILQTNQLTELQKIGPPGTVLAFLEPLYAGGLDNVPPGSSCIANVYSNNHELLASKDIGSLRKIYLHIVDTVAVVHAMIIRLQAIVLPLKVLVFGGH